MLKMVEDVVDGRRKERREPEEGEEEDLMTARWGLLGRLRAKMRRMEFIKDGAKTMGR
jgi:hypothetical protein